LTDYKFSGHWSESYFRKGLERVFPLAGGKAAKFLKKEQRGKRGGAGKGFGRGEEEETLGIFRELRGNLCDGLFPEKKKRKKTTSKKF